MLVSLTVGKVDAGVAVLLTEDKRLIEFPSILLPPSITSGSIVDITVAQNHAAEKKSQDLFQSLQQKILNKYGLQSPAPPNLRLRTATQTSLVLEWDPIELATSKLRSLSLFRNGSKAGNIPRPLEMLSTKISGLAVDTAYSFHMVLRTSGGTYSSETLTVRTHKMTDLTGITVTPGVLPPQLRDSLQIAVARIGARLNDGVKIDTTHFVCTEGRGRDWERAVEMNIPVVRPEWIEGCEREGKIVGVRGYYLDAKPKDREIGSNPSFSGDGRPLQQRQQSTPRQPANGVFQSQTSLPSRATPAVAQTSETPASVAIGQPSPEIPPTPPPKDSSSSAHSATAAATLPSANRLEGEEDEEAEEDEDHEVEPKSGKLAEEDEDEEDEVEEEETPPQQHSTSPPVVPMPQGSRNDHASAEDESADMEEVSL